jgi:addiction module HigA family antidote
MEKKIERLKRQSRRPATPGDVLEDLLPDTGLTQGQLAQRLGVSRQSVNELISGKRSVTPDMAQRLGRFFGNGPALWLNLQKSVDMWDTLHMDQSPYKQIEPLKQVA